MIDHKEEIEETSAKMSQAMVDVTYKIKFIKEKEK